MSDGSDGDLWGTEKEESPVQKKLNDLNAKWWTYWKENYQPLVERIDFIESWALESYKQRQVLPFQKEKLKDCELDITTKRCEHQWYIPRYGFVKCNECGFEIDTRLKPDGSKPDFEKTDEILCAFLGHDDGDYICGNSDAENCPNDKCPARTQEPFDLESLKDPNIYPRDHYGEDKITLYGPHYRMVKLKEYQKLEKRIKGFKENLEALSDHLIRVVDKNNELSKSKFEFPEKTIEWMVDRTFGCNSELHDKLLEAMQLKDFNKMNRWFGYYQRLGEDEGYWSLDEIIEKVRKERDEFNT